MNNMITTEQKAQYNELLGALSVNLDVTEEEYKAIVKSYETMGEWLSSNDSPLSVYSPKIQPQGSFLLGTMIRPISDDDDIDIDLVCKLTKKPITWTQKSLKNNVGDRIKARNMYNRMLDEEGKRCWTLKYANEKYHMDVLPCFVSDDYQTLYESTFSNADFGDVSNLAIRITDKTRPDFATDSNVDNWLKSNPFGYAKWFLSIANKVRGTKMFASLSESVAPVPKNNKNKLPLQVVIQLLKRHRDIMFDGDDKKPISIIITTLAAKAYNGEDNIYEALLNIANNLTCSIENRGGVKYVTNPVNTEENFADRWVKDPVREQNFYKWVAELRSDIHLFMTHSGQGLPQLKQPITKMFGESLTTKSFSSYGVRKRSESESGILKMATTTGILSATGVKAIAKHNFYGSEEN